MKGPSFITLKVPIFYFIDQDYFMLFFCVRSDFVISVYRGGSSLQILRPINSEIPKLILKSILWPNLFSGSMNDGYSSKLKDCSIFRPVGSTEKFDLGILLLRTILLCLHGQLIFVWFCRVRTKKLHKMKSLSFCFRI